MIKAVIFDMDGVVVDSEPLHFKMWAKIFKKEFGVKLVLKDFENLFGTTDLHTAKFFLKKYKIKTDVEDLRQKKKKLFQEEAKKKLKLFSGAKELIRKLSRKYQVALTSTEWKETIKKDLSKFNLLKYFHIIVGKEDVKRHKPDPQPYLATAKKLRVKPSQCIVVEDSVWGVESAKRAGMRVIAVTTSYSKERLRKADLIVKSLKEITI